MFVTVSGDIYIDDGWSFGKMVKWSQNTSSTIDIITTLEECYDIFVDISNTIYCAAAAWNYIAKKWLFDTRTDFTVAAGGGSTSAQILSAPRGVFVDTNFTIYVADYGYNRIQKFLLGQMDGITVAGTGAPGTYTLLYPTDVTLDSNGYIFIIDSNHRVIGQGPYGFRCLFNCAGTAGSGTNQLSSPQSFSFDSQGNIYVVNYGTSNVKKISIASNSCSMCINYKSSYRFVFLFSHRSLLQ